jgi:hypothetical protein
MDERRRSAARREFFRIGFTPRGRFNEYGCFLRSGDEIEVARKGDAVAELGDGLSDRSKVLLNVLRVVGVAAVISVALLPVALAEEPYDVVSAFVCNDNFGRFDAGM